MHQKLLKALLLLVFMGLLPVSCCHPPTLDFLGITNISFDMMEAGPESQGYVVNGRTSTSILRLRTQIQVDLVGVVPVGLPSFTGRAMATNTCDPKYGGKGLKDKAEAIVITSRQLFNGVPPGQPLSQFVRCVGYGKYGSVNDTVTVPLPQLADSINVWATKRVNTQFSLYLSPKPRDNARQQFEVRIKLESGREVVEATPEILWE
jgi:hypothetical protein